MTDLAPPEAAQRRSSPLVALRERWRLGVIVTVLGLLLGALVGATRSASYTAEARVGVGTGSLPATSVAGYSLGAQEIAADYARSVTTDDAKATLAKKLGGGVAGISAINASPVPSSAIIRVDVSADSSALALTAVGAVTDSFVSSINAAVTDTSASSVLAQYKAFEQQLLPLQDTQATQRTNLAQARASGVSAARIATAQRALNTTTLAVNQLSAQATAQLAKYQALVAQPQAENGLRPVQSGYLVGSNRHSLIERWGLIGIVLGALAALALAVWADEQQVRRRRLRTAAAAAPVETASFGAAGTVLVVPAEGDLTLVSLVEGEALPAPVLELELELQPTEPEASAVHPDQLAVIPEPVESSDEPTDDVPGDPADREPVLVPAADLAPQTPPTPHPVGPTD